jgi:hypothetical protein
LAVQTNVIRLQQRPIPAISPGVKWIAVAALLAAAPALVLRTPDLFVLPLMVAALGILFAPRVGLYASILLVGIDPASYDPITAPLGFFFAPIEGLSLTPLEFLILLTAGSAFIHGAALGKLALPDPLVLTSALVLAALLVLGVEYGVSSGGDFAIAVWEVRSLLLLIPIMLATALLVTDKVHLRGIAIAVIPTLLLMTVEAFWRYLTYVRSNSLSGPIEFAFGHETALLVGLLVVLCSAWVIWGPNRKERLIALAIAVLAFVVLITMRRRAGLIGAETGLICLGLFLLLKEPRRFAYIAPVFLVASAVYLAAFWNDPNSLGQPARAFRTVYDSEPASDRDRASDEYRRAEILNVWWNIQANPIDGAGFGTTYAKPLPMWNLSAFWPFWDYIPHNTILWLWMKGGILAFLAFWCLVGFAIQRAAAASRLTHDRLIQAAAASVCAYIVMFVMFSYVDLGLTNARLIVILGISFGLVSVFRRLAQAEIEPTILHERRAMP